MAKKKVTKKSGASKSKAPKPKAPKFVKVKSFSELHDRCEAGDVYAQQLVIGTLNNFGCDSLAGDSTHPGHDKKWARYYYGLQRYLDALCSEYGVPEGKAIREVLGELNSLGAGNLCSDVNVND